MFEVKLIEGSFTRETLTCDVGDLLPTMATLMQGFEAERGKYAYQRTYAITWRRVKE